MYPGHLPSRCASVHSRAAPGRILELQLPAWPTRRAVGPVRCASAHSGIRTVRGMVLEDPVPGCHLEPLRHWRRLEAAQSDRSQDLHETDQSQSRCEAVLQPGNGGLIDPGEHLEARLTETGLPSRAANVRAQSSHERFHFRAGTTTWVHRCPSRAGRTYRALSGR